MAKDLQRKALISITSYNGVIYPDGTRTGLFFTEALHPFEMLTQAGFEVDLATETGTYGLDDLSLTSQFLAGDDKAVFENSKHPFNVKLNTQLKKAADLKKGEYGLFFASAGHAALYDYPTAHGLQGIATDVWNRGGIVAAVCHGPVLLPGVVDAKTGKSIIAGKTVTGFTIEGEIVLKVWDKLIADKVPPVVDAVSKAGADSLAETVGSIDHQKRAVHGLWQISLRSVELRKALQLSRRYAAFARSDTDSAATRTANLMVGMSLTYLAEYGEASRLLEHAIHDHPVAQRHGEMASFGLDGLTSAFGHLSTCLLARGLVDASIRAAERSIEEAQQIGQPVALCLAMTRPAGLLFPEIGALATAERYIAAILELADRHALHTFQALAACANGRVLFMRGDPASGTAALRSGLAQMEATGYRSLQTIFRGYFAEALTAAGDADEGLAQAEAALRFAEQAEYMRFVPELLCIQGRVIARSQPDNPKAEQILQRAIDLSQRQGALYWELRAALALAELWQGQGRRTEAYALLSPVYDRFSEGFRTPILVCAKTLLQATSGGR